MELYERGMTDRQIGEKVGATADAIRHWRNTRDLESNRPPNGNRTIEERFNDKWVKDEETECWVWQGNKNGTGSGYGYGRMWFGDMTKMAHRVAYELYNGPISDDEIVRHTCDNPPCVNPDYLKTGSMKDNMRDCINRDRIANGSNQGLSKLTEEDVLEIRHRYNSTSESTYSLADNVGVTASAIQSIVTGKTWKHVGGPIKG